MESGKRLIDANSLLEKVQFRMDIDNRNAEIIAGCVDITRRLIENAPTVDAVEAVRCKDCKHYVWDEFDGCYCCIQIGRFTKKDFFCSYGERKDDGKQRTTD